MASKKGVLGKGLNALLPSENEQDAALERPSSGEELSRSQLYRFEDRNRLAGRVAEVEVEKIRPNPYQPRQEFGEEGLKELAASIRQLGIIQPITVRALGEEQFEIISGERRLRAARRAGLERLPAYVRTANTEQMLEMALVENVQREELNPIEVALGYQRLLQECELTQQDVAQKVGKSRATVANMLRLLKLPPRVQAALRDGALTVGHARALIPVEDEKVQARLLQEIEEDGLTVRAVEKRVRTLHREDDTPADDGEVEAADAAKPVPEPSVPDRDALQLEAYREHLRERLSTQVHLRREADGGGTIEIAYYSDEDLERLVELLT